MQPLLFDEGWAHVVRALQASDYPAHVVGAPGAPKRGSSDEANIRWCRDHDAVFMTHDRGKKDKTIFDHLNRHRVHAVFLHNDLQAAKTYEVVRAVLSAEGKITAVVAGRHLLRHRLSPKGALTKR